MNDAIALGVLQLVALAVPPVAVLLQMLRRSENLEWGARKLSFGLAVWSILSFIGSGAAVLVYFLTTHRLPRSLEIGLVLAIVGLVPFAAFTRVLYRNSKEAHA